MRRSRRKSSVVAVEVRDSIGNFSTRFSSPSFVKRVEKLSSDQRDAIKSVGFGNLLLIPSHTLSKNLLVELMEKWSCEKRTFVLALGEISMTPMDVALVLGLRVIGKPVILEQSEPFSDLEEDYGAVPGRRKITVASLESRLDSLGGVADDDFIRTFLLFTFGTFLFPNTNGTIDTRYLSFLSNLDYVHQFAWGSAVLDDLIMWLSRRKEKNMQYVGGCLLFLQMWFYEHIDMARPSLQNDSLTFPRACRWGNSKSHPRLWVTEEFEKLRDDQIIWELQPTAIELEADTIKDILPAQTDDPQGTGPQSGANDFLANLPMDLDVKAKIDSDVDTIDSIQRSEMFNSLKPCLSPDKVHSLINADYLSRREVCNKHVESPSTSYDSPRKSSAGMEDDLMLKNRILQEKIVELEKEISELIKENNQLKGQLLSSPSLEKENDDLKKEVADLRGENQMLSLSTDRLVAQLEKLLFNEEINGTEET
ncbi:uncharacterized protein LOC115746794 [Rhodamnia argentea]|uniref:Uncharacterized protein LOC115746794 n=1 Tax=Rhodamnia argentea TaxID=178133 RepID=A0A8B8PUX0_9MYRT|nr:uncharacterized protein LOC115746794 [Rhodamnia argentea]XP_030538574.2 uncharacterized protein LOC115746794 [Rhodamnia argentea]XP_048139197.1 uncharacterized protein LOC115746794 [Rhodamnia argentea]XP_048139198.1 uncharacterized protein LOC115746794 [Rhodamnia argentea]